MTGSLLIYGATGYTGRLVSEAAAKRGLRPILAARNPDVCRFDLAFMEAADESKRRGGAPVTIAEVMALAGAKK